MNRNLLLIFIGMVCLVACTSPNTNHTETTTPASESGADTLTATETEPEPEAAPVLTPEQIVEMRDQLAKTIDSKQLEEQNYELTDETTEGGELLVYLENGSLVKMTAKYYGEMGRREESYYFENDQLMLARHGHYAYNAPMYMDKATAKEMGDESMAFDEEKTEITTEQFYFDGEKLVFWQTADGTIEEAPEQLATKSAELFEKTEKLINLSR